MSTDHTRPDIEPAPEWEPGIPIHGGRQSMHQGFLYNFRDDDPGESCDPCHDAATWPEPRPRDALTERDNIPRGSVEVA